MQVLYGGALIYGTHKPCSKCTDWEMVLLMHVVKLAAAQLD